MSEDASVDDEFYGLLADSEVSGLMRRMTEMKLPVSQEEIQVLYYISLKKYGLSDLSVRICYVQAG